jgi:hypothetical protein
MTASHHFNRPAGCQSLAGTGSTPYVIAGSEPDRYNKVPENAYAPQPRHARLLGLGTAVAIAYSRTFDEALYPIILFAQVIPKIAIAPLLVVWFGSGSPPRSSSRS